MAIMTEQIRPMTRRDAEPAATCSGAATSASASTSSSGRSTSRRSRPLVAEHDGRIVGTGVGSAHGSAGWVGVIFVAPDRRGTGLGRRITRTVIDDLEERGCRTQILIASPMGRPIYEREGFTVLDRQVRFTIDGLPPDDGPADPRIRPFDPADIDAIVALDRQATGEDRRAVLRRS